MYNALSEIKKGSIRLQSESVVSEKLGNGTFSYQVRKKNNLCSTRILSIKSNQ